MPSRLKPLNFPLSVSTASSLWRSVRKQCSCKIELSISTEIRLTRLFVHQSVGPHTKIASFCPQAFFSPREPSLSSSYLFERHFICSGSLVIFHLFAAHMIPVFIYPALLNHFALLAPFPSPPSSSTQTAAFLCFCPVLISLCFSSLLVISSILCDLPGYLAPVFLCPSLFLSSLPLFSPDPPLSIVPRAMLVQRHGRARSLAHTHILQYVCACTHTHVPPRAREREIMLCLLGWTHCLRLRQWGMKAFTCEILSVHLWTIVCMRIVCERVCVLLYRFL